MGYENFFCSFEDMLSARTRLQWVEVSSDVNVPGDNVWVRLGVDESTSFDEWLDAEQKLRSDGSLADKGFYWGKVRVKLLPDEATIDVSLPQRERHCIYLRRGSVCNF